MKGRYVWRIASAAALLAAAWLSGSPPARAFAAGPNVLLVGTFNGVTGQYTSIQSAVDAAQPGDWILVGPGDYHERQDYGDISHAAGVAITKSNLHLRGMDRNSVIVDGTKPASSACSATATDQDLGPIPANTTDPQGRNGIEVFGENNAADNVSIENLTVCNFLDGSGGNGNEIWWNGGDGGGHIGMDGYTGNYLTATSSYSNTSTTTVGPCCGVYDPSGSYGIFSSDATHGSWTYSYASNMADSAFYIGACQQVCDATMNYDHAQHSSLCLSSTNAGGYILVENTECDNNKTGLVSNAQNNDDWPGPQAGTCSADSNEPQTGPTGTSSCTVWANNYLHDNNDPNVPGNHAGGISGGGPVGTGLILAGTRNITLYHNRIENNESWGELIVDLPDAEEAPSQVPTQCIGGLVYIPSSSPSGPLCYYQSFGNVSLGNTFLHNGALGNPGDGDIGMATITHDPGNCFGGDTDPNGLTTDPPGMEVPAPGNPYTPVSGVCTTPNEGDFGLTGSQAICASELLAPCPALSNLCNVAPPLPCIQPPVNTIDYPQPAAQFTLAMPAPQPTMPDPCAGVPSNDFCASLAAAVPEVPFAALPVAAGALVTGAAVASMRLRRRRATVK